MLSLSTYRQDLEAAEKYFFPFIIEWKQTNLNNLTDSNMQGGPFLFAVAVNCLIDEVILMMRKKLINTSSQQFKLKFTDAQGVIFYRSLLILPIPAQQFYLNKVRNEWIEQLDRQLIDNNIYKQNIRQIADPVSQSDFFDYD